MSDLELPPEYDDPSEWGNSLKRYTIGGTTYHLARGRLYVVGDEVHGLEEIDDHNPHFYRFRDDGVRLVALDWGGPVHTQVKIVPWDQDADHPNDYVRADDFAGAVPARGVVPDGVHTCPKCGGWAGPEDKAPKCFDCGHGVGGADAE